MKISFHRAFFMSNFADGKAGQLDPTELLKLKNSRIKRLKKYEAKESEERGSGLVEFVGDGAG
jgi:hypothetical protein